MQRPTSFTVFGVLNIVFAVLGAVLSAFAVMSAFMPNVDLGFQSNNPAMKIIQNNEALKTFSGIRGGMDCCVFVLLGIAGVGLLKMKDWGRKLSIGYSAYAILFQIVQIVVAIVFVALPLLNEANGVASQQEQAVLMGGAIGGMIGGIVGGMCCMVYPIVLLVFCLRKSTKDTLLQPPVNPYAMPPAMPVSGLQPPRNPNLPPFTGAPPPGGSQPPYQSPPTS